MTIQSKWLTGKELVARWSIKDFELLDFVQNGLQPYGKGRKDIKPQLPHELVDIKHSIYFTLEDIKKLEARHNSFIGTLIDIEEWRTIQVPGLNGRYPESPGATYYSDGSTDSVREQYENLKNNLGIYQAEQATFPEYPWQDYKEREYVCNLDAITLLLLNSYYKREDIEQIEIAPNTDASIGRKLFSRLRQAQETATETAKADINDCINKGETPSIKNGIKLAMVALEKQNYTSVTGTQKEQKKKKYTSKTIRKWIKEIYPQESRNPGRRKKQK